MAGVGGRGLFGMQNAQKRKQGDRQQTGRRDGNRLAHPPGRHQQGHRRHPLGRGLHAGGRGDQKHQREQQGAEHQAELLPSGEFPGIALIDPSGAGFQTTGMFRRRFFHFIGQVHVMLLAAVAELKIFALDLFDEGFGAEKDESLGLVVHLPEPVPNFGHHLSTLSFQVVIQDNILFQYCIKSATSPLTLATQVPSRMSSIRRAFDKCIQLRIFR